MRIIPGRRARGQARESKPQAITAKHPGWQAADEETVGGRGARSPPTRDGAATGREQGRKPGETEMGQTWDTPITA